MNIIQHLVFIFLSASSTLDKTTAVTAINTQIKDKRPLTAAAITNGTPVRLISNTNVTGIAQAAWYSQLKLCGTDPTKLTLSDTTAATAMKVLYGKPNEEIDSILKRNGWEPVPIKPPRDETPIVGDTKP
jgi:hypothetical protein